MFNELRKQLMTGFLLLLLMTFLTGFLYPMLMTLVAQTFFPWQARGSLLTMEGHIVGSRLIGQYYTDPGYFWGRPSATAVSPYNGAQSGASNAGPLNAEFLAVISARTSHLLHFTVQPSAMVPVDLVMASGSGLDPDISQYAAFYQVPRIAAVRHISKDLLNDLITRNTIPRMLGIWSEPRVNVLLLNLSLDKVLSHE